MKKLGLLICLLLLSMLLFVPLQYAKAERWVEVARYEGESDAFVTAPFTCNYSEWRISYESYVETHFPMIIPGVYLLNITTFPQAEASNSTNYIDRISENPTQGKYYYHLIHNQTGAFYMDISTGFSDNYSIIVEQDIDSVLVTPTPVPTPASATPISNPADQNISIEVIVATVIAVIVAVAVAAVVIRRKK